jgi:hypothetical protein
MSYKMMPPHQQRQRVLLARMLLSVWAFPLATVLFGVACVEANRGPFSGLFFAGIVVTGGVGSTVSINFEAIHRHRNNRLAISSRMTGEIERSAATPHPEEEGHAASVAKRIRSTLFRVLRINAPSFMIFLIAYIYVLGIFRAFKAARSTPGGAEAVALFCLLTKVTGNKLQLNLLARSKTPLFFMDSMVFGYELATALLVRVMLLSIPDKNTAVLLSLFNAATELMTRAWFFVGYISKGPKQRAGLGVAGDQKFRRRGLARVVDGNNNMVVEYVTMALASAIVVLLSETGAFDVPTAGVVVYAALARVLGVQVFTEMAIDTFATALEAKGGMVPLHTDYLKCVTASNVAVQVATVGGVVAFVLGSLVVAR